jgi:hypothetical protein
MVDCIGGLNDHISQETLLFDIKTIGQDHGDEKNVLSSLNFVLAEANRHRNEKIDTPTMHMFLSQQSVPTDDRDIMKTLSRIDDRACLDLHTEETVYFVPTKLLHCCEYVDHSAPLRFREGQLTINFFSRDRFVTFFNLSNCIVSVADYNTFSAV